MSDIFVVERDYDFNQEYRYVDQVKSITISQEAVEALTNGQSVIIRLYDVRTNG